jgi:predicted transcriptional regulator
MNAEKLMRNEVKKYIDTADVKVVKMLHAMLEVDAEEDWWKTMPDNVKADLEESIKQADAGKVIAHEAVKKRYSKWIAK